MTLLISHIPKTAGTSLRSLVGKMSDDVVWVYDSQLQLNNPNIEFLTEFRKKPLPSTVMGHFSYGSHRLLGIEAEYATVLRNPFERILSLYRHQRLLPDSRFAAELKSGMSVGEFVASRITAMTNNHMCRVLAGVSPDAGHQINDTWLLEHAKHNLSRHYSLVGVSEDIGPFIKRLGARLGWAQAELPHENVTAGDPIEVSDKDRDTIVENNLLDIELYAHVKKHV